MLDPRLCDHRHPMLTGYDGLSCSGCGDTLVPRLRVPESRVWGEPWEWTGWPAPTTGDEELRSWMNSKMDSVETPKEG